MGEKLPKVGEIWVLKDKECTPETTVVITGSDGVISYSHRCNGEYHSIRQDIFIKFFELPTKNLVDSIEEDFSKMRRIF